MHVIPSNDFCVPEISAFLGIFIFKWEYNNDVPSLLVFNC